MGKVVDETGNRYGRLEVIGLAGFSKEKNALWRCRCDCGNETVVHGVSLRKGMTKSCGCLRQEVLRQNAQIGRAKPRRRKPFTERWNAFRERFWSHVDKAGGCWLWQGALYPNGYGVASRMDRTQTTAHRIAWELTNGPIPDGLLVLHHCDNRRCVNPAHLFLGTQQDNMDDMWAKGRGATGNRLNHPSQQGENNRAAQLTGAQVREIKTCLERGMRQCDVMRRFGLTRSNVWAIAHGVSWAHI